MNVESEIKRLMEKKSGTVKSFSEYVDLPYTTIRSILERGIMNAKVENVIKICKGLGIKPEEIMNYKGDLMSDIIEILYNLEQPRQAKVYSFAEKQLEEQINNIVEFPKNLPIVGKSAANPSIVEYGDVDIELGSFAHIPNGADCAIVIQGDSMEPLIKDGEIIFYKKQPDIENGEIAIVEINGDGVTCKKVYFNIEEQTIILRSLNDKYSDREVNDDEIRIVGKVILN